MTSSQTAHNYAGQAVAHADKSSSLCIVTPSTSFSTSGKNINRNVFDNWVQLIIPIIFRYLVDVIQGTIKTLCFHY